MTNQPVKQNYNQQGSNENQQGSTQQPSNQNQKSFDPSQQGSKQAPKDANTTGQKGSSNTSPSQNDDQHRDNRPETGMNKGKTSSTSTTGSQDTRK